MGADGFGKNRKSKISFLITSLELLGVKEYYLKLTNQTVKYLGYAKK
jgi:hypothetical protein